MIDDLLYAHGTHSKLRNNIFTTRYISSVIVHILKIILCNNFVLSKYIMKYVRGRICLMLYSFAGSELLQRT